MWSVLRRLVLAAAVYYIWKERNSRIVNAAHQTVENVLLSITENIRMQLLSLTVKKTVNTVKVAEIWNVRLQYRKSNGDV